MPKVRTSLTQHVLILDRQHIIEKHLSEFKPSDRYGKRNGIVMNIKEVNGKTAKVLTGWIIKSDTEKVRLTTVRVIEMYDVIELKDGRKGAVIEIFDKPSLAYEIELLNTRMETITAEPSEIEKIIVKNHV